MIKAFKYRIYPNLSQREQMARNFGCVRFVYNYYLGLRMDLYKNEGKYFGYFECAKHLKGLKKEYPWLSEADATSLQSSLRDLDGAYKRFFKGATGFPNFKTKKTHRFSYRSMSNGDNIQYLGSHIKLPKLGLVKTRNKLSPCGRILSATVSQTPSGKYYVSLCCTEVEHSCIPKTGKNVGVDLGVKKFLTTSDGTKIDNPKYLERSLKKLSGLQKELSRKTRGGSNWNKNRIRVAKLQEYIKNQRNDFLQKNFYIPCI